MPIRRFLRRLLGLDAFETFTIRTCSRCGLDYDVTFHPANTPKPEAGLCGSCVKELETETSEDEVDYPEVPDGTVRGDPGGTAGLYRPNNPGMASHQMRASDASAVHALLKQAAEAAVAAGWSFEKFQDESAAYFLTTGENEILGPNALEFVEKESAKAAIADEKVHPLVQEGSTDGP